METNTDLNRKAELIVDAFDEYRELIRLNPQLEGHLSFEGYLNFSFVDFFANERYKQLEELQDTLEKKR